MPTPLAERHCVVCKPGTTALSPDDVAGLLEDLPGWSVEEADGHLELTRTFKFKGFLPGVELLNRFATVAEAEGHHPDLLLTYGSLEVRLWTHAAGGLTENDFILAAKLERVAEP
ncbi:MAG: 4a-hydroxytetrahydrobiopterin dehydratase [Candidatus Dormiibacterota bacterium]